MTRRMAHGFVARLATLRPSQGCLPALRYPKTSQLASLAKYSTLKLMRSTCGKEKLSRLVSARTALAKETQRKKSN